MDEVSLKLLGIFQNVNEWLKFAEAKNQGKRILTWCDIEV